MANPHRSGRSAGLSVEALSSGVLPRGSSRMGIRGGRRSGFSGKGSVGFCLRWHFDLSRAQAAVSDSCSFRSRSRAAFPLPEQMLPEPVGEQVDQQKYSEGPVRDALVQQIESISANRNLQNEERDAAEQAGHEKFPAFDRAQARDVVQRVPREYRQQKAEQEEIAPVFLCRPIPSVNPSSGAIRCTSG